MGLLDSIANQVMGSLDLAEILPQVIDKLTPGGAVPTGGGLAAALGMLKRTTA